ncbi:MerR family transcriptional regulator [Rubrobacter indicoceani]|uniref:MerR family transcriptional regulator n=1 Tax=Rubrobacter indicoceani TaxID=2051957 RepID=UPI000E5C0F23|nr:MerR family transcriptional regulator [Rubrobacter indicoceani]
MGYTVGKVATLAGITVKTLHHYDEIGLLSPTGRSEAGYRIYAGPDVERLQRILFYRELGFSLDRIARIVNEPDTDATEHLRQQRELLGARIKRLQRMISAIDREMEAGKMDIKLTPEERLEVFGDWSPEDYAGEAEQRYGDTEFYRESQRRVSSYTKENWLEIRAEQDGIESRLAVLFEAGAAPCDEEAMDAAEAHRRHISRWYYDCGYEVHVGLGEMYVVDERFRASYDRLAPGLSGFVKDAITANANRAG